MNKIKRKKTPTLLQMEATECGAAALGIVLGYYGLFLPLESLRIACGVSRDGSNALNLLKVARQYNLEANGVKAELNDFEEGDFPLIAFWQFNHFVVVEGYNKNEVFINDPAYGPRKITQEEFASGYTGVALLLKPTTNFKKFGRPSSLMQAIKGRLHYFKSAIFYIALVSILLVVPGILLPGLSKIFIDNLLIEGRSGWIMPFLTALFVISILQALLVSMQRYYLLRLQMKFVLTNTSKFIWHLLKLPIPFFQQRMAGDLYHRIAANERVAQVLSVEVSSSFVSVISLVFFAIVLLFLSWQLAIIGIGTEILTLILFYLVSRKIQDKSLALMQTAGKLSGFQMAMLQMIESIKAQATEDPMFDKWGALHAQSINQQQVVANYQQMLLILPPFLHALGNIGVLIVGALLVMKGVITVGSLIAIQSLLISFSTPLASLLNTGIEFQRIKADFTRIDDVLKQQVSTVENIEIDETDLIGPLTLDNVSFSYSPVNPPLLKNISLTIHAKERLAIIGPSGCGKSTLIKLIAGLYPVTSGEIRYNNHPLSMIPPAQLAKHRALAEQDIFLFSGSLRDNLTLWRLDILDSILIDSLNKACLWEEVIKRGGLDLDVLEGGMNFSQGQQQRIEIARALSGQPKVLILDESTSGLDPKTEFKMLKNIQKDPITTIVVTHRLDAIRTCDRILVMDKGEIIAQGTHHELENSCELYRKFLRLA